MGVLQFFPQLQSTLISQHWMVLMGVMEMITSQGFGYGESEKVERIDK